MSKQRSNTPPPDSDDDNKEDALLFARCSESSDGAAPKNTKTGPPVAKQKSAAGGLPKEELRINKLNKQKLKSKEFCYCFTADVLPDCIVYEVIKI